MTASMELKSYTASLTRSTRCVTLMKEDGNGLTQPLFVWVNSGLTLTYESKLIESIEAYLPSVYSLSVKYKSCYTCTTYLKKKGLIHKHI